MEANELLDPLLQRAFHSAVVISGKVYIFGGSDTYQSTIVPFHDVVEFCLQSLTLTSLCCENDGPERSHHAASALSDTQMCVVGGWNGKQRTSDVFILNVQSKMWLALKMTTSSHIPAGLSGHTCTIINANEMLVTGREGGIRMQRRFGSVFKLSTDISRNSCKYTELPLHIASRSGHTCSRMTHRKKSILVLYGGRDSDSPDVVTNVKISIKEQNPQMEEVCQKLVKSKMFVACKAPKLRFHTAVSCDQYSIMHGGEIFGKARETVDSSLYIHDSAATKWWRFKNEMLPSITQLSMHRMGHCLIFENNKLLIIGGIGRDGKNASGSIIMLDPH